DHRRTANIDVLHDAGIIAAAEPHFLERVEIDNDQIDGGDTMLLHRILVLSVVTNAEKAAMNKRMKRLDASIHNLREACQFGHIAHGEAFTLKRSRRSAG